MAKIRWGILGTANIAVRRFIPGAAASRNGEVVAIASRDGARAQEIAARLGVPRAHASYEALLADPGVDSIYNALPNALHAEWTLLAAAAGKPVLCEKPLAATSDEAQAVVDGCRRQGVALMEAFMYRFHPQHAHVHALLDAGAIGELRAVRSAFTFMLEPFDPNNVRLRQELAGGALMDVGCYCVNAVRVLFAEEPLWASAQWDFRPEFGVEVALAGVLGFSDNRMATFDCGFRASGQGSYTVAGTAGTIAVPTAFVPHGPTVVVLNDRNGRHVEPVDAVDQYRLEAEEFAAALIEGRAPHLPAEDAVLNLRAIEALRASAVADGTRQPV